MKKTLPLYALIIAGTVALTGIAVAAFGDKGEILGSSFSMGSADIKMLISLSGGTGTENLTDTATGPGFSAIGPNWTQDYLLKIFNNSSAHLLLTSNSEYETINDPDDLRNIIYVEPFNWNDANNDGIAEANEIGSSFGRKTIVKWKTEGFDLSSLAPGSVKGLILRFSTDAVSDTKQGKSAIYDFIFDSISL